MSKTLLVAGCALILGSTVMASDFATDWLNFRDPQLGLIDNVNEVLREQNEFESCIQQQQEALHCFLSVGVPYSAAVLMAYSQYPCDSN
jgi:hypothetical protein